MGLFKRNRDGPREEKRQMPDKLKDFITGVDMDGGGSSSGVAVDELKAMQTSAVYACVKILAETVASLPLQLFKNEKDEKHKATEHPLYECLYELPNVEMTSFQFREIMILRLRSVAFGRFAPSAKDSCSFVG